MRLAILAALLLALACIPDTHSVRAGTRCVEFCDSIGEDFERATKQGCFCRERKP